MNVAGWATLEAVPRGGVTPEAARVIPGPSSRSSIGTAAGGDGTQQVVEFIEVDAEESRPHAIAGELAVRNAAADRTRIATDVLSRLVNRDEASSGSGG